MNSVTTRDAENELSAGQRELANLGALLQVMELAAEAQASGLSCAGDVDWWGLMEIARRQLASVPPHLEGVETFLRAQSLKANQLENSGS